MSDKKNSNIFSITIFIKNIFCCAYTVDLYFLLNGNDTGQYNTSLIYSMIDMATRHEIPDT
jgi:hypothetical protein